MGLRELAAGITVTDEQEERGVPEVDAAEASLADRLAAHDDALPCTPAAAATVLESHTAGRSVGESAREAGVAPMTAAKALHRCGVAGISPLAPAAREVVRDWLAGELPRSEAEALTGAGEAEFALAAYVETHDPVPALAAAAEGALAPDRSHSVAKRDALGDTMSSVDDLR
jgi:hypothetical protein